MDRRLRTVRHQVAQAKLRQMSDQEECHETEADITRFVQSRPDRGDLSDTWPCWGTVLMECPAELVAKWAPGAASFEAVDERITRIRMGAWSWPGLIGFLATFNCRFTVEGPPELAEAAREVRGRIDVEIPAG